MDQASRPGLTGLPTTVYGKIIEPMVTVNSSISTGIFIKETGSTIKLTE